MTEHRGTSFFHSCVKMPVDPYSRQPTPSYERPRLSSNDQKSEKMKKINFAENKAMANSESSSPRDTLENFLEFLKSIPDYEQVHHLSNEQFKQKVEYLRRKQRLLLQNLRNSLDDSEESHSSIAKNQNSKSSKNIKPDVFLDDLKLNGKKCYLEESRTSSPILFPSGSFASLAENQDLLTYRPSSNIDFRCRNQDKEEKTIHNKEILAANKSTWNTWSESKSNDSMNSDDDNSIETKSLPPDNSKEWHPTVPKPFSFTLREEAEKYMTRVETAASMNNNNEKRNVSKKRRVKPIPITSKIPLYDKLIAEKEERSRIVREESALNLLSQVRPFKLECDRRAWRSMARSSPELCSSKSGSSRFKAKPVPRNLFGTEIYDRMLEDEYYRQLQKRVRAAELLKSSSLPPSMARRERVKSACSHLQDMTPNKDEDESEVIPAMTTSDRTRSAITSMLSSRGNNLAAILRCQASREKLEREIRERMEEKRREQILKFRETLIGRKPAWKALRSAARHEHDRDLDMRTSLRRDEAREQAERHRLQMEMMLDRVIQIPTLFERYSQSFQSIMKTQQKTSPNVRTIATRKKKKRKKQQQSKRSTSSSLESYLSFTNNPRSNSLTSSSGTLISSQSSSKSSGDSSDKSVAKSETSLKRKTDRGPLKVSINETAQLIEDPNEKLSSSDDVITKE